MKKCPSCQRTFDDNMRFCQTDGTPLADDAPAAAPPAPAEEEAPFDPYATIVGVPKIANILEVEFVAAVASLERALIPVLDLQHLLDLAGDTVVLVAHDQRVENPGGRRERIHRRVNAALSDRPLE